MLRQSKFICQLKMIETIHYKLPETKVSNASLALEFNVKEDYIFRKTRIKTRYTLKHEQTASDLAEQAINEFFQNNSIKKEEVDFLIFCSEGFDYIAGVTSAILQHKCGLRKNMGVMDLPQGCTGYIYGLMIAKSLLLGKVAKNILFVTSDHATKTLHPESLELRSIFGDAAAVTLITEQDCKNIGEFVFGTDGSGAHLLYIESSAARNPRDKKWIEEHANAREGMPWGKMVMDGLEIFLFTLRVIPTLVEEVLEKNKLIASDIDLYIFHQANGFMLERLRKKINIPEDKFFLYIENIGNTVSSTIPICLNEANKQGKIKAGMKIMLVGFGIGLCWGATIIKT